MRECFGNLTCCALLTSICSILPPCRLSWYKVVTVRICLFSTRLLKLSMHWSVPRCTPLSAEYLGKIFEQLSSNEAYCQHGQRRQCVFFKFKDNKDHAQRFCGSAQISICIHASEKGLFAMQGSVLVSNRKRFQAPFFIQSTFLGMESLRAEEIRTPWNLSVNAAVATINNCSINEGIGRLLSAIFLLQAISNACVACVWATKQRSLQIAGLWSIAALLYLDVAYNSNLWTPRFKGSSL